MVLPGPTPVVVACLPCPPSVFIKYPQGLRGADTATGTDTGIDIGNDMVNVVERTPTNLIAFS